MKKINKIPSKTPFRVPDNYFEEVNRKIISLTAEEPGIKGKKPVYRRLSFLLAAAATVTILAILSYMAVRFIPLKKSAPELIFAETLPEPFMNEIDIFTIEENAEAILFSDGFSGIRKSDIVDYLMHENIDTDDIYDKL